MKANHHGRAAHIVMFAPLRPLWFSGGIFLFIILYYLIISFYCQYFDLIFCRFQRGCSRNAVLNEVHCKSLVFDSLLHMDF